MASVRSAAPATQRTSEGFEAFREGLDLLRAVAADPDNIVIGPEAFYLNSYGYEGFGLDLVSDYRVLSVVQDQAGGRVLHQPAGARHLLSGVHHVRRAGRCRSGGVVVRRQRAQGSRGGRRPRQPLVSVRAVAAVRVHRHGADHADDAGRRGQCGPRRRLLSDREPAPAQGKAAPGAAPVRLQLGAGGSIRGRGQAPGTHHLDHRLGDAFAAGVWARPPATAATSRVRGGGLPTLRRDLRASVRAAGYRDLQQPPPHPGRPAGGSDLPLPAAGDGAGR